VVGHSPGCPEMSRFVITVIFGNKFDLSNERKVSKKEALDFAENINFDYTETSALTGYNVDQAFYELAKALIKIF
ncbi:MAG: hypothetical protein ACOC4M_11050, partial [Promethearchaeia archaeon]